MERLNGVQEKPASLTRFQFSDDQNVMRENDQQRIPMSCADFTEEASNFTDLRSGIMKVLKSIFFHVIHALIILIFLITFSLITMSETIRIVIQLLPPDLIKMLRDPGSFECGPVSYTGRTSFSTEAKIMTLGVITLFIFQMLRLIVYTAERTRIVYKSPACTVPPVPSWINGLFAAGIMITAFLCNYTRSSVVDLWEEMEELLREKWFSWEPLGRKSVANLIKEQLVNGVIVVGISSILVWIYQVVVDLVCNLPKRRETGSGDDGVYSKLRRLIGYFVKTFLKLWPEMLIMFCVITIFIQTLFVTEFYCKEEKDGEGPNWKKFFDSDNPKEGQSYYVYYVPHSKEEFPKWGKNFDSEIPKKSHSYSYHTHHYNNGPQSFSFSDNSKGSHSFSFPDAPEGSFSYSYTNSDNPKKSYSFSYSDTPKGSFSFSYSDSKKSHSSSEL